MIKPTRDPYLSPSALSLSKGRSFFGHGQEKNGPSTSSGQAGGGGNRGTGRADHKPLKGLLMLIAQACFSPNFVIPAKAGIHHLLPKLPVQEMDSRVRGNDEVMVTG